jgi:hypothetical protein
MTTNPHPDCPICRLVHAAQGQPIKIALSCLKLAAQHRCTCRGRHHAMLYKHPHAPNGCQGFRTTSGVVIGLAAHD